MKLTDYQALAMRTAKSLPSQKENLNHAALGIASEYFEMKYADTLAHSEEERGDLCWFIALACDTLGFDISGLSSNVSPHAYDEDDIEKAIGEILTINKRCLVYGKPLDSYIPELKQHLANVFWITDGFSTQHLELTLQQNIDKLRLRYPDKYSDADALARADKDAA